MVKEFNRLKSKPTKKIKIMKTFDEQFNQILIENYFVAEDDILDNSRFLVELNFELIDIVNFIIEVQNKFQVVIPRHDIKHVLTVGGAKKYIKLRLKIYNYDYNN